MNRRDILSIGAVSGLAVATQALAQKKPEPARGKPAAQPADPHAGHHAAPPAGAPAAGAVPAANAAFAAAAEACVARGEACQAHCIRSLSTGDKSMAACMKTVTEMLAICRAVGTLAHMDSKHLKAFAAVCAAACADCEAACKEHAPHHAECKACMEACAETQKAARALA